MRTLLTIGAEVKEAFILSGAAVIGPAVRIILTIIAEASPAAPAHLAAADIGHAIRIL